MAFANLIQVFRNLSQGRPAGNGKKDRTILEFNENLGRYKRPSRDFTHNISHLEHSIKISNEEAFG